MKERRLGMLVRVLLLGLVAFVVFACGGSTKTTQTLVPKRTPVAVPPEISAIVDSPDRDPADKALDAGRRPGEMLAFFGVKPGMKILEIGAASGYTSELLGRAVGSTGLVYVQNNDWVLEKFAEKPLGERLAKPRNANLVKVVRSFDDPAPPEAREFDAIFCVLFYHDLFWMDVDRDRMNRAVMRALKPGGIYAIIDHSGRAGTGSSEVKSIHRIEEKLVREEIQKAGFKFVAESNFLRNPDDPRDWSTSPGAAGGKRGTSDRFALKFAKP